MSYWLIAVWLPHSVVSLGVLAEYFAPAAPAPK